MDDVRTIILIAGFAVSISAILLTAGGLIYQLRKVTTDVDKMKEEVTELNTKITAHIGDNDAHVNHLYMQTLKESVTELKAGNKEIIAKVDRLMEKLMDSQVLKHIN